MNGLGFDVLEAEDGAVGLTKFHENYTEIEVTLVD
jgi:hypothetical protein